MKPNPDIIVVGAGISGLAFAWKAARAGRRVLVLESRDRIGGCIYSHRSEGYWFEMGAHTTYNSYTGFLDMAEGVGASAKMLQRGPARVCFGLLHNGVVSWLTPPKVLCRLNWLEVAIRFPFQVFRSKKGLSVASYYSRLLGSRNYANVLRPFFAAVPSQPADDFPVSGPGSLFKKRERQKGIPKSYGFDGGLQTVCDGVADLENVIVMTGVRVESVTPVGEAYSLKTSDGREFAASVIALAIPPYEAAGLLRASFAELASTIAEVQTVELESMGVVLSKELCSWPQCAFVVPVEGLFHSVVTRDPHPDPGRRAFTFHFKAVGTREDRLKCMAEVLGVDKSHLSFTVEHRLTLPSPRVGHKQIVNAIDANLPPQGLALCGNYFAGLAIEDCVQRSFVEWERVSRA